MPLDAETVKFIVDQNERLENNMKEYMALTGTATRGTIKSEVDRIDQMDKIRNGKIGHNKDEIDIVKEETSFGRWAQRNKKVTVPVVLIFVIWMAIGSPGIDARGTFEKVFKVEFKKDK